MTPTITAARTDGTHDVSQTGCYTLLYAERGKMALSVADGTLTLQAGEVCLLLPTDAQKAQPSADFSALSLCLPTELAAVPILSPLFSHFANGVRKEVLDQEKIAFFDTVCRDILKIAPDSPFASQLLLAHAMQLLAALPLPDAPAKKGRITAAVLAFTDENLSRAISLDDIAAALFISKYHMSHVFKAENGISVGEAVLRRKVAHAKRLLGSGIPAHRVSEMVGFNHYSAFFRIFKRITGRAPTGKQ